MAAVILVSSAVCVGYAPSAIAATGKDDPREVVVDEVAGQAVTFLASPLLVIGAAPAGQVWLVAAGGFALFRVFDIIKPWPIRKLERLPKGWGILADDLLAGVYAWIVLQVCVRVFLG
jgi:phosphatidylglycerophosphatase A